MARYENGWVKFHRSLLEKDIFNNMNCYYIWSFLMLTATYKESNIMHLGKRKKIAAGTVVFSIKELAIKMKVTRTTVKRWLNYLIESERIELTTHTKGSICYIKNWEKYQSSQEVETVDTVNDDIKVTSKRHQGDIKVTHIKKVRKKEVKNKSAKIVFDFLNQELTQWTENVSDTIRQKWMDRYHPETISSTLQKAKDWSDAKGRDTKNVALLMNTFFKDTEHDAGHKKGSGFSPTQLEGFAELDKLIERK